MSKHELNTVSDSKTDGVSVKAADNLSNQALSLMKSGARADKPLDASQSVLPELALFRSERSIQTGKPVDTASQLKSALGATQTAERTLAGQISNDLSNKDYNALRTHLSDYYWNAATKNALVDSRNHPSDFNGTDKNLAPIAKDGVKVNEARFTQQAFTATQNLARSLGIKLEPMALPLKLGKADLSNDIVLGGKSIPPSESSAARSALTHLPDRFPSLGMPSEQVNKTFTQPNDNIAVKDMEFNLSTLASNQELSESQIKSITNSVSEIMQTPNSSFSVKERVAIAAGMVNDIANPDSIGQGDGTFVCGEAVAQYDLIAKDPVGYAESIKSLVCKQELQYKDSSAPIDDLPNLARNSESGNRNLSSRLFQTALAADIAKARGGVLKIDSNGKETIANGAQSEAWTTKDGEVESAMERFTKQSYSAEVQTFNDAASLGTFLKTQAANHGFPLTLLSCDGNHFVNVKGIEGNSFTIHDPSSAKDVTTSSENLFKRLDDTFKAESERNPGLKVSLIRQDRSTLPALLEGKELNTFLAKSSTATLQDRMKDDINVIASLKKLFKDAKGPWNKADHQAYSDIAKGYNAEIGKIQQQIDARTPKPAPQPAATAPNMAYGVSPFYFGYGATIGANNIGLPGYLAGMLPPEPVNLVYGRVL